MTEEKVRTWVNHYRLHGLDGLQPKRSVYSAQFKLQVLPHQDREQLSSRQIAAIYDIRNSTYKLSLRARDAVTFLQSEMEISATDGFVVSRRPDTPNRTLTFAGIKANRTLARRASNPGKKIKFDALGVQAMPSMFEHSGNAFKELNTDELAIFSEPIKFAACLPSSLLAESIQSRFFDLSA